MLGITGDAKMPQKNELREKLAEVEHEQWRHWASKLISEFGVIRQYPQDAVKIVDKIIERWHPNFVEYINLPEKTKDFDRIWADRVLRLIKCKNHGLAKIFCMDCVNEGSVIFVSSEEKGKYKIFKKGDLISRKEMRKNIDELIKKLPNYLDAKDALQRLKKILNL